MAEGPDADEALAALREAVEQGLGEEAEAPAAQAVPETERIAATRQQFVETWSEFRAVAA